jgi:tetratricopeptide (TPR) repeat protein
LIVTRASRFSFAALGFIAVLSPSLSAFAEEAATTPSPARVLFKEARELVANGDYQAACPKFEQSLALETGLGTQFNLADCWEHIGRTASAQALFLGAAASAKAAGQAEREQVLRDRAAALEPRIARLVIEVSDPNPKLVVKRGDLPLDSEAYGKAKAVDPGSYQITAKAPGKKTWQKQVEVAAGASVITVEVPVLQAEPKAEVAVAAPAEKPAPAQPKAPPPKQQHASSGPNWALIGLGTAAVGGLALGSVMAVKYSNANSDAKATCPSNQNCTPQEIAFHDQRVEDAKVARNWSIVGFGVGAVGLGAAAALLFLPKNKDQEKAWVATPVIATNGTIGANLSGSF